MNDVLSVQILYPQTNVNEYFPDKILDKVRLLLLHVAAEIMVVAILHHYIDVGVLNE
jgi:hypothetical protein